MRLDVTITEKARALLERIRRVDARLQSYVAIDEGAVLREAARLDAISPGDRGPLHGQTLAVKDIIDVAGLPTRAGSSFYRRDPDQDAPVVATLRAAGALIIGKTNTHEFAWGMTTENPHFGRTGNPWNLARTPGGSSGGSGAAVAAGLADIALGTDTLGSIRVPAAVNGISGFRPATGALSIDGIFPLAIGLDTVGPFARDLATVQYVYEILSGMPVPRVPVGRVGRLRGGRWDVVEPSVASALDEAVAVLRADGFRIDDVAWWEDSLVRAVAVVQQRAAARVHEPFFATHRDEYGEDVRARVAQSFDATEADEIAARDVIERAHATWNAATKDYDVVLAPSVGMEAPLAPVGPSFRDETVRLVAPASAFALPAVAIPIGFGSAGMPIGMQLMASRDSVPAPFAVGLSYQTLTDWHRRVPPLD